MRIERAIRMECLGYSDADISTAIGITPGGLHTMKMTDEYKQLRVQIASGVLSDMDAMMGEETEDLRLRLRTMVPTALQAIADNVLQKQDPKLRQQAAETILDRDGRFIKASRTVVNPQDNLPSYMNSKDDEQVLRILQSQQVTLSPKDTPKTKEGETIQ